MKTALVGCSSVIALFDRKLLENQDLVARHVWVVAPFLTFMKFQTSCGCGFLVGVIPYNSVRTISSRLTVLQSSTHSGLSISSLSMLIGLQKQIMVTSLSANFASKAAASSNVACSSRERRGHDDLQVKTPAAEQTRAPQRMKTYPLPSPRISLPAYGSDAGV